MTLAPPNRRVKPTRRGLRWRRAAYALVVRRANSHRTYENMDCPHCGLASPDTALRCRCGYQFSSGRKRSLRLAVTLHVLMLPLWLASFSCSGALLVSGPPEHVGRELLTAAFAVIGVGVILWAKLLADLIRWSHEARNVSWRYPARWAAWSLFNIYFAIAFLFPSVRNGLAPRAVDRADPLAPIQ